MTMRAISHYEILNKLGAGGMGEVYRARDSKIGRDVAIKVLPAELANDGHYAARLQREARILGSLNHPHIAAIYGLEENAIVMELVQGETLASRLNRGSLPVDLLVRYGSEIAAALAAAHARGIIHRDLKPGNVILTKSGVKVLDFGLAKTTQGDETVTASHVIMGTPAYMGPEQLEGSVCDARTDIFALGLVLFEMATGKRLSSAQQHAPPLDGIPNRLAHVIARCLERDPDNRWQTVQDVKAELEWAAQEPPAPKGPVKSHKYWHWGVAAVGCVALAAAGVALLTMERQPERVRAARFILSLNEHTNTSTGGVPVPSPDGSYFVFVGIGPQGAPSLWIRPLDSARAKILDGTERATSPFWSPDGQWIAFYADGKLKKVTPSGGPSQTIANLPAFSEGTWGTKGDIIYRAGNRTPLYRIHESGGSPKQITTLDGSRTENSHRSPSFLPDGRRFLFTARCAQRENNALYTGSLDSPTVRRLMPIQSNATYVPPRHGGKAHIVYYRDGALIAQPFDPESEKFDTKPVTITDDIAYGAAGAIAWFALSADGRIVVAAPAGFNETRLSWFDRNGSAAGVIGPRGELWQPRLSPTGDRVAFTRPDDQTGNRDVWYIETARGVAARLTTHVANDWFPVWSPDGKQILFGSDRGGGAALTAHIKTSMDPGMDEAPLTHILQEPHDWSRDRKWISYGFPQLSVAPIAGEGKPFQFIATPFMTTGGRFSPDGKWIAYASNETGRFEIYVRPFTGGPAGAEGKIQMSNQGGDYPVWRADGGELFYMASDLNIYAVNTKDLGRARTTPMPSRLFRACPATEPIGLPMRGTPWNHPYDTHDGQRFLISCRADPPGRFVVLLDWMHENH